MSENVKIPDSHKDLLERPIVVSLATVNPSGQPQVTPVWVDYDGTYVRVNSARGRQKVKNMEARPQVTILAVDPDNAYRWMEVRGRVEDVDEANGLDHINKLSKKYRGEEDYYQRTPQLRGTQTRVMFKIRPTHVVTN
jgi:PPOX class probable F420-dependent enzyme